MTAPPRRQVQICYYWRGCREATSTRPPAPRPPQRPQTNPLVSPPWVPHKFLCSGHGQDGPVIRSSAQAPPVPLLLGQRRCVEGVPVRHASRRALVGGCLASARRPALKDTWPSVYVDTGWSSNYSAAPSGYLCLTLERSFRICGACFRSNGPSKSVRSPVGSWSRGNSRMRVSRMHFAPIGGAAGSIGGAFSSADRWVVNRSSSMPSHSMTGHRMTAHVQEYFLHPARC